MLLLSFYSKVTRHPKRFFYSVYVIFGEIMINSSFFFKYQKYISFSCLANLSFVNNDRDTHSPRKRNDETEEEVEDKEMK